MKKLSIAIMLSFASTVLFAQDVEVEVETDVEVNSGSGKGFGPLKSSQELSSTSKNGQELLPQAGDWGLGIGASGVLGYFGDLLNATSTNDDGNNSFQYANTNLPQTVIYGKYFITSDLAYRGFVRLNYSRSVSKSESAADLAAEPDQYVTNSLTTTSSGVTIGAGLEKRRGSGRLIGVYGAQAYIDLDQEESQSASYGNAYSLGNQNPTGTVSINNSVAPDPTFGDRLIKSSEGSAYGLGVAAFIGAEYYFAPKMSVGGEFYWGISYTKDAVASETWEAWEPSTGEVAQYVSNSVGGSSINAGLDNVGGAINLFLYF